LFLEEGVDLTLIPYADAAKEAADRLTPEGGFAPARPGHEALA
jgi:hypothetical protein